MKNKQPEEPDYLRDLEADERNREHQRWLSTLRRIKEDYPDANAPVLDEYDKQIKRRYAVLRRRKRVDVSDIMNPEEGLRTDGPVSQEPVNDEESIFARPLTPYMRWKIVNVSSKAYQIAGFKEVFLAFLRLLGFPVNDVVARQFCKTLVYGEGYQAPLSDVLKDLGRSARVLAGNNTSHLANEIKNRLADYPEVTHFLQFLIQDGERVEVIADLDKVRYMYRNKRPVHVHYLGRTATEVFRLCMLCERIHHEHLRRIVEISMEAGLSVLKKVANSTQRQKNMVERINLAGNRLYYALSDLRYYQELLTPVMWRLARIEPDLFTPEKTALAIKMYLGIADSDIFKPRAADPVAAEGDISQSGNTDEAPQKEGQEYPGESRASDEHAAADDEAAQAEGPNQHLYERFQNVLRKLATSFPGSQIGRIFDFGDVFLLPYFDKVYEGKARFSHIPPEDIKIISSQDPIKDLYIFYFLIEDGLKVIKAQNIDEILFTQSGISSAYYKFFVKFSSAWEKVDRYILKRYLKNLYEYSREQQGVQYRRDYKVLTNLQNDINIIRNQVIKHHKYQVLKGVRYYYENEKPVHKLVSELNEVLKELIEYFSFEKLMKKDSRTTRLFEALREDPSKPLVEFPGFVNEGGYHYLPFIGHAYKYYLKKRIPASKDRPADVVTLYRQIEFFTLYAELVELIDFLLNSEESIYARFEKAYVVETAGKYEEKTWQNISSVYANGLLEKQSRQLPLLPEYEDALTGLANRRYLDQLAPKIHNDISSKKKDFSIIELDIDHFKWINDNFGHASGDKILRHTAHRIKEHIRPRDLVFRVGGEEFSIIIRGDLKSAVNQAERLRKILDKDVRTLQLYEGIRKIMKDNGEFCGTLSAGVAPVTGEINQAREKADRALYEAKKKRNVVKRVAAPGDSPQKKENTGSDN